MNRFYPTLHMEKIEEIRKHAKKNSFSERAKARYKPYTMTWSKKSPQSEIAARFQNLDL